MPPYRCGGPPARLGVVDKLLDKVGGELRGLEPLQVALGLGGAPADDLLDAAVAYEIGCRCAEGSTVTVGDVAAGFIVLPTE